MASDKTNVMRVLEQHKIAYKPHEYPHGKDAVDGVSVAELLGQNPDHTALAIPSQTPTPCPRGPMISWE